MRETLILDRTAFAAFEVCPRRFQLRYLKQLPWPTAPLDRKVNQASERGRQFHRLLERHFLGLAIDAGEIEDAVLRDWWNRFASSGLQIPVGNRWPEHRLTIPLGNSFLTGRFDLLVLGEENDRPFARLFDWKTSRPRPLAELESDWQTRLYLALIAESGGAFFTSGQSIPAASISLSYWYVSETDQPRVIQYSAAKHAQNWSFIEALVAEIEAFDNEDQWPLTTDLGQCRYCTYQIYCGRQDAGTAGRLLAQDTETYSADPGILLEPQTP